MSTKPTLFKFKNIRARILSSQIRIANLETDTKVFNPLSNPGIIQSVIFQEQGTQFVQMSGVGDKRKYITTAPSTVDEETLASVVAYATFDDIGGNGNGVLLDTGAAVILSFTPASFTPLSFGSEFLTPEFKVPLYDNEGKTAWYRGHISHLNWSAYLAPEVVHTKQFMVGHSLECNVPGTVTADQRTYAYYDSHTNFNVSSSLSVSLWFYPTNTSTIAAANPYRILCYRYQDANNYFMLFMDSETSNQIKININELSTLTKIRATGTDNLTVNAWNNVIFTFNATTDALILYINGTAFTTTNASTDNPPYSTDSNLYIGGLPNLLERRFNGYVDNFVFWSGKVLTSTEVTNMWTRGTII